MHSTLSTSASIEPGFREQFYLHKKPLLRSRFVLRGYVFDKRLKHMQQTRRADLFFFRLLVLLTDCFRKSHRALPTLPKCAKGLTTCTCVFIGVKGCVYTLWIQSTAVFANAFCRLDGVGVVSVNKPHRLSHTHQETYMHILRTGRQGLRICITHVRIAADMQQYMHAALNRLNSNTHSPHCTHTKWGLKFKR